MRDALMSSSTGIIAEFKRKSPSKGWIKEKGKASVIPLGYQHNGASALSILTDIDYFGGYDEYIQEALIDHPEKNHSKPNSHRSSPRESALRSHPS